MFNQSEVAKAINGVKVSEEALNAVVGITVVDEALLDGAFGAHNGSEGHGWFNTVSGECFFGISCNPVYWYK